MSVDSAAAKVLLIALDGLTLPLWQRWRAQGMLSSLDAHIAAGTVGGLRFSLADARFSSVISAMTGCWPDQHGIVLPQMYDGSSQKFRPVDGMDRVLPAWWEILDTQGEAGISVGWPASISSDLQRTAVVDSSFGNSQILTRDLHIASAVRPSSLVETVSQCWVRPEELDAQTLAPLVPRWQEIDQKHDKRLYAVSTAVAETVSRHAAFLELLDTHPWRFATVYLSLPGDLASLERAAKPSGDDILTGLPDRGGPLINAFLHEILRRVPKETNLILAGLPFAEKPSDSGVVLCSGPSFAAGAMLHGASVIDLAPTAVFAAGYATSLMAGRAWREIFASQHPERPLKGSWKRPASALREGTDVVNELMGAVGGDVTELNVLQWKKAALSSLARSYLARGATLRALPILELAVRLQPDNPENLLRLADCQRRLGLHSEALANAWDAVDLSPPDLPQPLLQVALLEAMTGNHAKAKELLESVSGQLKKHPEARILYARLLIGLRMWPEALKALKELVGEQDQNALAHHGLARVYLGLRQWQNAVDSALKSVGLNYHDARAHEILGHALIGIEAKTHAWKAFEVALRVNPDWPRPLAKLIRLAHQLKHPPEEIASMTERYRAMVASQRKRSQAYLEEVKADLASRGNAEAATWSIPTSMPKRKAPTPPRNICGITGVSREGLEILGRYLEKQGRRIEGTTADFWAPLLSAPAGTLDLPLEDNVIYLIPAAAVPRLPTQHSYYLIHVIRPAEELVTEHRRRSTPTLGRLSDDDMRSLLDHQYHSLIHTLEFSPNIGSMEISYPEAAGSLPEPMEKVIAFLNQHQPSRTA